MTNQKVSRVSDAFGLFGGKNEVPSLNLKNVEALAKAVEAKTAQLYKVAEQTQDNTYNPTPGFGQ